MKNIEFIGTVSLPAVDFNKASGRLSISGTSIPENVASFYGHLIDWLVEYSEKPAAETRLDIKFKYYNTSTSKCLIEIFKILELIYRNDKEVVINWYYEKNDIDMLEGGQDYQSLINAPFNLISIK